MEFDKILDWVNWVGSAITPVWDGIKNTRCYRIMRNRDGRTVIQGRPGMTSKIEWEPTNPLPVFPKGLGKAKEVGLVPLKPLNVERLGERQKLQSVLTEAEIHEWEMDVQKFKTMLEANVFNAVT